MFRSYKILLLSTLFSLVWFSAYSQGRDLQFGAQRGAGIQGIETLSGRSPLVGFR
jgi:hypothetical protein